MIFTYLKKKYVKVNYYIRTTTEIRQNIRIVLISGIRPDIENGQKSGQTKYPAQPYLLVEKFVP